jgi:hypothetical protein
MKTVTLTHEFVQEIPEHLTEGALYVSLTHATVVHLCCCGCREEVVTPLTPTDWKITFDGESISLWPSIGSWTLQCRSHYVIERGRVVIAKPWSAKQIEKERQRDAAAKRTYFSVLGNRKD